MHIYIAPLEKVNS